MKIKNKLLEYQTKSEFDFIGWEGIDNDGDGRINEDGPGYYDPNRNWAWNWQPKRESRAAT